MSPPPDAAAKTLIETSARREPVTASTAATMPVTRADFDRLMVPCFAPAAFVPVRGEGSRVWDQDGRMYVDFASGVAVTALGHCHPAMIRALEEQSRKLWHVSNWFTNEPALRLAERLVQSTFAERVFFCNSGAEANEAALKLARRFAHDRFGAHKLRVVSTLNAFHGRTLLTVTAGGQAKYAQGFGPNPAGFTHIPYNDVDALEAAFREEGGDDVCAVILEPMQGEGGMTPGTPAFLHAARRLTREHNALLILDEIQSGMGRTGALFSYMQKGVVPDILTSAKGARPTAAIRSPAPLPAPCSTSSTPPRCWTASRRATRCSSRASRPSTRAGTCSATCAARACGSAASWTTRGAARRPM